MKRHVHGMDTDAIGVQRGRDYLQLKLRLQ